jgi:uncharacterized membrane protein YphA (DoxX/SURF4 family)
VAGLFGVARRQRMTTSPAHFVGGFLLLLVRGAGAYSLDALIGWRSDCTME